MGHEYMLELTHVGKEFPGVKALDDVCLYVGKGEIHALIGENGAGKSTLMKILSGAYKKDSGTICFKGKEVTIDSPAASEKLGIAIIYQELNLINGLTVAENIYLSKQPKKNGIISWSKMFRDAGELLSGMGVNINARAKVSDLSIAQKQLVEIAKAIACSAQLVIMDEPTSSLTSGETAILMNVMRRLRDGGNSVIFISHRLDEIFQICDKLSVLRDGRYIGTKDVGKTNKAELISMMIGRELTRQYPARHGETGDVCLKVENLSDGRKIKNVSFEARRGEVLGFAGLVGSGRTETMRLIFGADRKKSGTIVLNGSEIKISSPIDGIKRRLGFVTENRKEEGLFLGFSCKFNATAVAMKKLIKYGIIRSAIEDTAAEDYVKQLNIVTPSTAQKVSLLSGGNQQKIVLAKWLYSDAEIMILDEPTRGIDVGAKYEIYEIIGKLAQMGKAVIVISSEMEEILGISDRIIVMRNGEVAGEVNKDEFSQEKISSYAIGG